MSVPFEHHRQIPTASAQLPLRQLFQAVPPRVGEWPELAQNVISPKVAARARFLLVNAAQLGACTASMNHGPLGIANLQGRGPPLRSPRPHPQGLALRMINGYLSRLAHRCLQHIICSMTLPASAQTLGKHHPLNCSRGHTLVMPLTS
jgi:hypothetical protein